MGRKRKQPQPTPEPKSDVVKIEDFIMHKNKSMSPIENRVKFKENKFNPSEVADIPTTDKGAVVQRRPPQYPKTLCDVCKREYIMYPETKQAIVPCPYCAQKR